MDPKFAALVEHLAPNLERLREMAPHHNGGLPPDMPKCGVYLFSEGDGIVTRPLPSSSSGAYSPR